MLDIAAKRAPNPPSKATPLGRLMGGGWRSLNSPGNACNRVLHIPMKIAGHLKILILLIRKGFYPSVLCFLFIRNINVSLGPISVPTLDESVASLQAWSVGTFLQLKEMIGNGTTSFTLSTSSRISITSADVLSLSIVTCASWLSPPTVAIARLCNDTHMLHVPISLECKLRMLHIICVRLALPYVYDIQYTLYTKSIRRT